MMNARFWWQASHQKAVDVVMSDQRDFKGKVAIVTGGAAGIGRATALEFARRGASVVVADLNEARGDETINQIRQLGAAAIFTRTDVADESHVMAMVQSAVDRFGRIDVLVNNAGIVPSQTQVPLHDVSLELFQKVMAVNVAGTFLGMKHAIPQMLKNGGGAVVNVSSVSGMRGSAGDPSYPTSKHAVIGLTRSAALTYAEQGVRINSVGPGVVKTDMTAPLVASDTMNEWLMGETPMKRFADPSEIAKLIVFLCSDEASFMTGGYYPVDGGWLAQ